MKNLTKKQKVILIAIVVIIFGIGLLVGTFLGIFIEENTKQAKTTSNTEILKDKEENNVFENSIKDDSNNQNEISSQELPKVKNQLSEKEMEELKIKIEKDEADYGNNYLKFRDSGYASIYQKTPDKIYYKSGKENGFYKYETNDENFEHLLEVIEDRMSYTVMEDYNLYAFTPDSIQTMLTSKDNYIIFDYDNGALNKQDANFQKDIIFRFSENTRLYRLVTYLSQNKELISKEEIGKKEFATDTSLSGYKYMMYDDYNSP